MTTTSAPASASSSTTSAPDPLLGVMGIGITQSSSSERAMSYQNQIDELKAQLASKEEQIKDLERGLEAQVHMVMELELVEQKETAQWESRLEANQALIGELGERVGLEARLKAELESQLTYTQAKCNDQEIQLARLVELNATNSQLISELKSQGNDRQWDTKLEFMMESNQKLVLELAKAQEDMQSSRKEVSHKELLVIELNSQLDKLASQLKAAQEETARVKSEFNSKELTLEKTKNRLELLEKSILEEKNQGSGSTPPSTTVGAAEEEEEDNPPIAPPVSPGRRTSSLATALKESKKPKGTSGSSSSSSQRDLQKEENNNINKKQKANSKSEGGLALLLSKLKTKEEECTRLLKERDTSLKKATKLSLALAASRESVDSLQEKLDYQNAIVDKVLGTTTGRGASPTSTPLGKVPTPSPSQQQQHLLHNLQQSGQPGQRHSTGNSSGSSNNNNPSTAPTPHTTPAQAVHQPTHATPRRHSSFEKGTAVRRTLSGTGGFATGKSPGAAATAAAAPTAPFDGRRIRNFFNRGRSNSSSTTNGGSTTTPVTATATATANGTGITTPTSTKKSPTRSRSAAAAGGFVKFQRGKQASSGSTTNGGTINGGGGADRSTTSTGNDNDDPPLLFNESQNKLTNQFVGKEDQIQENCQGGGGDVNLALTL